MIDWDKCEKTDQLFLLDIARSDLCIHAKPVIICFAHVDDSGIMAEEKRVITWWRNRLKTKWDITCDTMDSFLGMEIKFMKKDDGTEVLCIGNTAKIEKLYDQWKTAIGKDDLRCSKTKEHPVLPRRRPNK